MQHVTEPPAVAGPKLAPVDEASSDPSLVRFRSDLLGAVMRHDTAALIAAVDPNIRTTFGESGGVRDSRRQWKLDDPGSPIWKELEQVLSLGGSFNRRASQPQFWAPYVYSAWPDSEDAFQSLAIIAAGVPLHERPDTSSPAMAMLSFDIVKRGQTSSVSGWTNVQTADGRAGWVSSEFVRSPIGYRASFVRSAGRWRMNALVAGD